MRRPEVLAVLAALVASPTALAEQGPREGAAAPPAPFIRVRRNQFVAGEQPFRFVGANLAIMHGPDNRAAADDVVAGAARDGVRVGRVWALGEGDANATPWLRDSFLFRAGPRGWIEAGPRHLDRVVAAAARAGMRLIVTLSNSWSDYGGVPRYLRWVGQWRDHVYGAGDRFYSDAGARAAYREHLERLLDRTNALTGVRYRDDPTILGWELMNESTVSTAAGAVARRAWIAEMAALLHRLAPNQLVSSGVSGYRVARERDDWLAACRLPGVDFCDGHIYPEEAVRAREPALAAAELDAMLDEYVRLAQTVAGKPFVLGEFGVRGDGDGLWLGMSRAAWTDRIFERLRYDGAAGGLLWIYQRAGGADRAHGIDVGDESTAPQPVRVALRSAAAALVADLESVPSRATNPSIAVSLEQAPLLPLHREVAGRAASIPFVNPARPDTGERWSITWDPTTYARADWEATGIYGGGEVEHAWGAETGWFEYQYQVVSGGPSVDGVAAGTAVAPSGDRGNEGRARLSMAMQIRARVSSEYPGTLSPPDGASAFEVSLDGAPLATAVAVRDDGRGRWVTLRVPRARLVEDPLAPGRHRLRFTVPAGSRAHGLSIYGRPGTSPARPVDSGPIELDIGPR